MTMGMKDSEQSVNQCRICKGPNLTLFLALGDQPHCNRFVTKELLNREEPRYPLDLYFCHDCKLMQLGYTVSPESMFKDYPYVSGTTATLPAHFHSLAKEIAQRFSLKPDDLVVDIGSNDGTFLKGFQAMQVKTLGVDPATAIVKMANEQGVETIEGFFSGDLGEGIARERGRAKVITAAGVFFHVEDLDSFVRGVKALLADDGVFMVQAIYLVDMLKQASYDNIYHEHLCYYSLGPLTHLFRRFQMEVFDVQRSPIHGGSILVYVRNAGKRSGPVLPSVKEMLAAEEREHIYDLKTYQEFAARVERNRGVLVDMLKDLKRQGKRIAAYGAPAKGNTLLNYCRIGTDILECATEKNRLKCDLYTPGMHIPVVFEEEVWNNPPDYYLLLPWNFQQELLEKERAFRAKGGKFIIPVPDPHIV